MRYLNAHRTNGKLAMISSERSGVRMSTIRRAMAGLLVFTAFLAGGARASDGEEAPPVESFTLDNGLEVVVIPDHRAPIVTHMVWYKVGSADEVRGKTGIAHFLEHLLFKGTKEHPPGEFSGKIAAIGGRENAFTSSDYTAYYQQVPPDALEEMMAFEADRMRNLVLTDAAVDTERGVVIAERRTRIENQPSALLSEEVDATLYQNHPYGVPVIGWMHEIEKLNRRDALDFYDRYYAPNNAILIVAGDVNADTVRSYAAETYAKVPRGPALEPRERPTEPEQNTARTVTLHDARISVPTVQRSWVVPSYNTASNDDAEALDLLGEILGGGVRSRIYQELVVRQGIAASAGAWYRGTALDDSSFSVYASPRGGATIADVEKGIKAEIAKVLADGVTEEELEAAKNRYVRSVIFARDDQAGMARIYGSTLTTGGTVEDIEKWPERIRSVTAEQVKAVAARYLDESRSVTGYLLPEGKS